MLVLEFSRFSRNYSDLQKFLEICARTDTLVLDEKGIYDLRDFNDRLLLGLKWVVGREIFMPCRRRRTPARRETKLSDGKRRAGDACPATGPVPLVDGEVSRNLGAQASTCRALANRS